jgi:hypothetical protein
VAEPKPVFGVFLDPLAEARIADALQGFFSRLPDVGGREVR